MARGRETKYMGLPPDTLVDVVATKNEFVYIKQMSISEYGRMQRKKGWYYRLYQIGTHSFKSNI